ncbi:hypothetical protein M6B38_253015 [Iris pallida]|uniref:Uncharacterized protein n=1 Tax=Iris pallida TaxID=29817 RepID=A0AAX6G4V9_IRIPA|nr:hypothetical protein M6B38_229685 [Iris pallida]KAJ6823795.1 hypothetical protein M6B38_129015 [Iris pallida]KAJ6823796.1 hypothetical protein M6B38_129020 [Iris pallida]KAJ6852805.1 hypothetical protein M6B38_253015 [Iris pallida]
MYDLWVRRSWEQGLRRVRASTQVVAGDDGKVSDGGTDGCIDATNTDTQVRTRFDNVISTINTYTQTDTDTPTQFLCTGLIGGGGACDWFWQSVEVKMAWDGLIWPGLEKMEAGCWWWCWCSAGFD